MPRFAQFCSGFAAAATLAAAPVAAADLTDAAALALTQKHCSACHARNPKHPVFDKAPKGIFLETLADLRANAARAAEQIEDRTMPLGNETDMTEGEREAFEQWAKKPK